MFELKIVYDDSNEDVNEITCLYDGTQTHPDSASLILDLLTTGKLNKQLILSIYKGANEQDAKNLIDSWSESVKVRSMEQAINPVVKPNEVFSGSSSKRR